MPEVSVVIPVYNAEKYLKEAIESVIQQTFKGWELLLVDDGSEDSSPEICDAYSARFSSIHSLHINHTGVSAARNAGLEKAVGEWILFLDSDDLLDVHALEIMLEKSGGCGAVSCGVRLFGRDFPQQDISPCQDYSFDDYADTLPMAEELLRLYFNGIIANKLFRRERLHYRFDTACQSSEDTLFALKTLPEIGKLNIIHDVLYYYRMYPEPSLSKTFRISLLETHERVFYAYVNSYQKRPEAVKIAATNFSISAVRYFDTLVNTEGMPADTLKLLILSQLENCPLLYSTPLIRQAVVPKGYASKWEALLTHDVEIIYSAFLMP